MVDDKLCQVVHKLWRVDQGQERLHEAAEGDPEFWDVQAQHQLCPGLHGLIVEDGLDEQSGVHSRVGSEKVQGGTEKMLH